MAVVYVKLIGGFIRWLFHRCKTNLRDEIEGNLEAKWFGDHVVENYIIGWIAIGVVFLLLVIILSLIEP